MITWLLRNIFWAIDGILRFAIHLLYELIMQIASARLFQTYIFEFMDRIYTFLAIFMVFKLSISMVNYILNPEQFTDKSKGFGKIIQSVIIVIALIIFVPTIFDWAYRLQCMVLNSGVLNSVITGSPNKVDGEQLIDSCMGTEECSVNDDLADLSSNMLTYNIMSAFVYRDSSGQGDDLIPADVSGNHASAKKGSVECSSYADTGNYEAASNCIFNYQTLTSLSNSYIFLISTACLGFVAYVFLGFTIDIAIRSVKLCFLQLMSPIPIISMLDPSSGKNGMFGKWLKECTKTYGDLFIRLGAVYFAVELIGELFESEICADNAFVKIFIVLGVLAFAKQLPQFIGNIIPGAKFDSGGLSLKKKFGSVPGLNKAAAGAIGLGGGMAANAIAGDWSKGNRLKTFGSMLAGAGSGAFRGMTSKEKNAWKAGQGAIKGAVNARNLRDARNAAGVGGVSGFINRRKDAVEQFAGINNDIEKFEKDRNKEVFENISAQEARAEKQIKAGQAGDLSAKYFEHTTKIEQLKGQLQTSISQQQSARENYMNARANGDVAEMRKYTSLINQYSNDVNKFRSDLATAQAEETALVEKLTYQYIDDVQAGTRSDGTLNTLIEDYQSYTEKYNDGLLKNTEKAADRHSQGGKLRGRNAEIDREMQKETVRKGFNDKK